MKVEDKVSELEHAQWCRDMDAKLALVRIGHFKHPHPEHTKAIYEWIYQLECSRIYGKALKILKESK